MDECIPDFVITRKRKRNKPAIDPCLGYYPPSSQPSNQLFALHDFHQALSSQSNANYLDKEPSSQTKSIIDPSFAINPSSFSSFDAYNPNLDSLVTVDEFLHEFLERPFKVNTGRKKRTIVNLGRAHRTGSRRSLDGEVTCNNVSSSKKNGKITRMLTTRDRLKTSHSFDHRNGKKRAHRNRTRGSFAKRLLRAAVMTNVQPGDTLIPNGSSRQPLQFVRSGGGSFRTERKRRTMTLVDPRKTVPFHHASFSSAKVPTIKSTDRKPLTKWRSRLTKQSTAGSALHKKTIIKGTRTKENLCSDGACPPLLFLPLPDAEQAYQSRLNTLEYRRATQAEDNTQNLVVPQTRNCDPPLTFVAVSPFKPHTVVDLSSYRPLNCSSTYSQVPNTNIATRSPAAPIVPLQALTERAHTKIEPDPPVYGCPLPPPGQTSFPQFVQAKKPLKSLTSFFDGFLENARNAKQIQASFDGRPEDDYY